MHPSLRLQCAAEMDDRKALRTRQVPKDEQQTGRVFFHNRGSPSKITL